jgi:hypothetical protein
MTTDDFIECMVCHRLEYPRPDPNLLAIHHWTLSQLDLPPGVTVIKLFTALSYDFS